MALSLENSQGYLLLNILPGFFVCADVLLLFCHGTL